MGVNVWSGLRVPIACPENASGSYDACHVIDWNGPMPANGYLKCLKQEPIFRKKDSSPAGETRSTLFLPSLSEALAEGMLSSRSGIFSRVALSSL